MDVVTHGMMGVVLAAPFAADQPEAAFAFMMGSVLPDADALGRVGGKRNFLRCHQTFTHSLPIIAAVSVVAYGILAMLGFPDYRIAAALGLGMAFHSLLDYSNTYGITLLAPFSRKRFCREWVFFIDLPVMVVSAGALAMVWQSLQRGHFLGAWVSYAYSGFVVAYWAFRIGLRRRAKRLAPEGTLSLLPTAFVPWKFLGARRVEHQVHLFDLSALDGSLANEVLRDVHDDSYETLLQQIPEFRSMRGLSPLYHAVEVEVREGGVVLTCRDLRTRNFNTRFGELTVTLDAAGVLQGVRFHV
jgi:membrane-bound metal-dependent hydrolase YbcI (DUF457 family)